MTDVRTLIGEMTVPVKISEAQADLLARYGRHLAVGTHRLSIADTLELAAFARAKARRLKGMRHATAAALARGCNRAMHDAAALCRRLGRELEGLVR